MKLENKVVFITGGGNGMGRATVLEAVKEGAKVAFAELKEDWAKETVELAKELGGNVLYYIVDVTDSEALVNAINDTAAKLGKIDVLVNNVGYDLKALIHEVTEEQWYKCLDINLKAPYIASKTVLPAMMEDKNGVIINISSAAGRKPSVETPVYCAAKAGLNMLTQDMALAYGRFGIRVNAICPGLTRTTMLSQVGEEYVNALKAIIPLGRMGEADEIAKAVVFLASDDAAYVTGEIWGVTGGI